MIGNQGILEKGQGALEQNLQLRRVRVKSKESCDGEGRLLERRWKDGTLVDEAGEQKVQSLDPWRRMSESLIPVEPGGSWCGMCLLRSSKMV